MSNNEPARLRRQVPRNFEVGDSLHVALDANVSITTKEQAEKGEWLFTVRLKSLTNNAAPIAPGQNVLQSSNARSVLWRVTDAGELEFVITFGERQRLIASGISAREKKLLRHKLGKMTTDEASQLLREIVESGVPDDSDSIPVEGNTKAGH